MLISNCWKSGASRTLHLRAIQTLGTLGVGGVEHQVSLWDLSKKSPGGEGVAGFPGFPLEILMTSPTFQIFPPFSWQMVVSGYQSGVR